MLNINVSTVPNLIGLLKQKLWAFFLKKLLKAREPDAEQVDLSLSNEGLSLTLLDVELSPKCVLPFERDSNGRVEFDDVEVICVPGYYVPQTEDGADVSSATTASDTDEKDLNDAFNANELADHSEGWQSVAALVEQKLWSSTFVLRRVSIRLAWAWESYGDACHKLVYDVNNSQVPACISLVVDNISFRLEEHVKTSIGVECSRFSISIGSWQISLSRDTFGALDVSNAATSESNIDLEWACNLLASDTDFGLNSAAYTSAQDQTMPHGVILPHDPAYGVSSSSTTTTSTVTYEWVMGRFGRVYCNMGPVLAHIGVMQLSALSSLMAILHASMNTAHVVVNTEPEELFYSVELTDSVLGESINPSDPAIPSWVGFEISLELAAFTLKIPVPSSWSHGANSSFVACLRGIGCVIGNSGIRASLGDICVYRYWGKVDDTSVVTGQIGMPVATNILPHPVIKSNVLTPIVWMSIPQSYNMRLSQSETYRIGSKVAINSRAPEVVAASHESICRDSYAGYNPQSPPFYFEIASALYGKLGSSKAADIMIHNSTKIVTDPMTEHEDMAVHILIPLHISLDLRMIDTLNFIVKFLEIPEYSKPSDTQSRGPYALSVVLPVVQLSLEVPYKPCVSSLYCSPMLSVPSPLIIEMLDVRLVTRPRIDACPCAYSDSISLPLPLDTIAGLVSPEKRDEMHVLKSLVSARSFALYVPDSVIDGDRYVNNKANYACGSMLGYHRTGTSESLFKFCSESPWRRSTNSDVDGGGNFTAHKWKRCVYVDAGLLTNEQNAADLFSKRIVMEMSTLVSQIRTAVLPTTPESVANSVLDSSTATGLMSSTPNGWSSEATPHWAQRKQSRGQIQLATKVIDGISSPMAPRGDALVQMTTDIVTKSNTVIRMWIPSATYDFTDHELKYLLQLINSVASTPPVHPFNIIVPDVTQSNNELLSSLARQYETGDTNHRMSVVLNVKEINGMLHEDETVRTDKRRSFDELLNKFPEIASAISRTSALPQELRECDPSIYASHSYELGINNLNVVQVSMPDGMCGTSWTIVTGWAFTLYDIVPPAVTINSGSMYPFGSNPIIDLFDTVTSTPSSPPPSSPNRVPVLIPSPDRNNLVRFIKYIKESHTPSDHKLFPVNLNIPESSEEPAVSAIISMVAIPDVNVSYCDNLPDVFYRPRDINPVALLSPNSRDVMDRHETVSSGSLRGDWDHVVGGWRVPGHDSVCVHNLSREVLLLTDMDIVANVDGALLHHVQGSEWIFNIVSIVSGTQPGVIGSVTESTGPMPSAPYRFHSENSRISVAMSGVWIDYRPRFLPSHSMLTVKSMGASSYIIKDCPEPTWKITLDGLRVFLIDDVTVLTKPIMYSPRILPSLSSLVPRPDILALQYFNAMVPVGLTPVVKYVMLENSDVLLHDMGYVEVGACTALSVVLRSMQQSPRMEISVDGDGLEIACCDDSFNCLVNLLSYWWDEQDLRPPCTLSPKRAAMIEMERNGFGKPVTRDSKLNLVLGDEIKKAQEDTPESKPEDDQDMYYSHSDDESTRQYAYSGTATLWATTSLERPPQELSQSDNSGLLLVDAIREAMMDVPIEREPSYRVVNHFTDDELASVCNVILSRVSWQVKGIGAMPNFIDVFYSPPKPQELMTLNPPGDHPKEIAVRINGTRLDLSWKLYGGTDFERRAIDRAIEQEQAMAAHETVNEAHDVDDDTVVLDSPAPESEPPLSARSQPANTAGPSEIEQNENMFKRQYARCMEVRLQSVQLEMDSYEQGLGYPVAYWLAIGIGDFRIIDHMHTSTKNLFLSSFPDRDPPPRQPQMGPIEYQLDIKIESLLPQPKLSFMQELKCTVTCTPLQFNISQPALNLFWEFFAFQAPLDIPQVQVAPNVSSSSWEVLVTDINTLLPEEQAAPIYFQSFTINSLSCRVNYSMESFNIGGLQRGNYTEFMNLLSIHDLTITIPVITAIKAQGIPDLVDKLYTSAHASLWSMNRGVVAQLISSLPPLRPFVRIGEVGVDVVRTPYLALRRRANPAIALFKGLKTFAQVTALEALGVGGALAIHLQSLAELAESLVPGGDFWLPYDPHMPPIQHFSHYANQPAGIGDALMKAKESLESITVAAKSRLYGRPLKDYQNNGVLSAAVRLVGGLAPTALDVVVRTSEAFGSVLLGLRNQFDPHAKKRDDAEFKRRGVVQRNHAPHNAYRTTYGGYGAFGGHM